MMLLKDYVDLVGQAEEDLRACGKPADGDRLHALSGIYGGTIWSAAHDKSTVRDACLHMFLARTFGPADDPRPCLRPGLFTSLRRNQAVGGVDMGHVLVGLDARMRWGTRDFVFPGTKSTELEITTWVGDLGGAAGRLALDRVQAPETPVLNYFSGPDYGTSSHLEGDVSAYCVAADPSASVREPVLPASPTPIRDVLEQFFVSGARGATPAARANRCRKFLELLGGTFAGMTLTNAPALRQVMADKFEAFGKNYLKTFVRLHTPMPPLTMPTSLRDALRQAEALRKATRLINDKVETALPHLRQAAEDVADNFLGKLLANKL
jgi:hypothetical protein